MILFADLKERRQNYRWNIYIVLHLYIKKVHPPLFCCSVLLDPRLDILLDCNISQSGLLFIYIFLNVWINFKRIAQKTQKNNLKVERLGILGFSIRKRAIDKINVVSSQNKLIASEK